MAEFVPERTSPEPLADQVYRWMLGNITGGVWPPNLQLRAENDLAAELGVNRGTLRRALRRLADEGLLVQVHGKGTFVRGKRLEGSLAQSLLSFAEALELQGVAYETQVLEARVDRAEARVAGLLGLAAEEPVFHLSRVRRVSGTAVMFVKNRLPLRACPGLQEVDFSRERLFDALERELGQPLRWAKRTFEARAASDAIASALALEVGEPVMYIEQVTYAGDDKPIECSDVWIPGSRFALSAVVTRSSNWEAQLLGTTGQQVAP